VLLIAGLLPALGGCSDNSEQLQGQPAASSTAAVPASDPGLLVSDDPGTANPTGEETMSDSKPNTSGTSGNKAGSAEIGALLAQHATALMDLPGVTGVGEGLCDGNPCVRIYVTESSEALSQQIEALLGSATLYAVVVSGDITAQPE